MSSQPASTSLSNGVARAQQFLESQDKHLSGPPFYLESWGRHAAYTLWQSRHLSRSEWLNARSCPEAPRGPSASRWPVGDRPVGTRLPPSSSGEIHGGVQEEPHVLLSRRSQKNTGL